MSCWKCGADVPSIECERCAHGPAFATGGPVNLEQLAAMQSNFQEMLRKAREETMANSAEFDWDKVTGEEDLRVFLMTLHGRDFLVCEHNWQCVKIFLQCWYPVGFRINKKHRAWEALKKYCKEQ